MKTSKQTPRVFIYGYHGFRNLGAEARLISMIQNLRAQVPEVAITVNTLDRTKLDYIAQDYKVEVVYMHPAFQKNAVERLLARCDVMVMAEGNMLTDEFSPLMVEVFVNAMERAEARGVNVVGLAIDSGRISPARQCRMVAALNTIELLTVRAPSAERELRRLGVTIPIEVTADCALSMPLPDNLRRADLSSRLGLSGFELHAVAPVDFHMWPAKISLIGRREDYLRWPIKATWGDGGRRMTEQLTGDWVRYVDYLLGKSRNVAVPLLIMDPADRRIANKIAADSSDPGRVHVLSGDDLTPLSMSAVMSSLSSITTSRYHALVLPLPYGTPFIALGHDTRTKFISEHLGMNECFVPFDAPDRVERLMALHAELAGSKERVEQTRSRILAGVAQLRHADQRNYELLGALVRGERLSRAPYVGHVASDPIQTSA